MALVSFVDKIAISKNMDEKEISSFIANYTSLVRDNDKSKVNLIICTCLRYYNWFSLK